MSAFAAMIDALFADPNIAADAVYLPQGGGGPVAVRAVLDRPDRPVELLDAALTAPSAMVEVRVSEVSVPKAGDSFEIAGVTWLVQGEPKRDALRQVWTLELVEQ